MNLPIQSYQSLRVVRGDLIPGGLKTLALLRWLPTLNKRHYLYTGSVLGSGAWALAEACACLGYEATLFLSHSAYTPGWLATIAQLKTRVIWTPPMPVRQLYAHAEEKMVEFEEALNLPLGFDHPGFIEALGCVMREIGISSSAQIWVPAVSGVLGRAARTAWPQADLQAVAVARFPGNLEGMTIHQAPEKFYQAARKPPLYPACPFSDAKVWQFASRLASPEAVIWNVSR